MGLLVWTSARNHGFLHYGKGEKIEHENANRVFLLNRDGKPLMPCCPRKARLLLKSGKAFVVKKYPWLCCGQFTKMIRMRCQKSTG
ncbi:RRXRR domain-containing protein [Lactobacillus delbrueckii]|uniref:RRXRR domain-containing protein n=1 Tax=Lactobacillus delbrueckii TaxID=1584 RepID=UPI00358DB933